MSVATAFAPSDSGPQWSRGGSASKHGSRPGSARLAAAGAASLSSKITPSQWQQRRESLMRLQNASSVAEVVPMTTHQEREVRLQAIAFLCDSAQTDEERLAASRAVLPLVGNDSDVQVRVAALNALEQFAFKGDADAVAAAAKGLRDWHRPAREAALRALQKLSRLDDEIAVSAVAELLEDSTSEWRLVVGKALATLTSPGDAFCIERVASRLESDRSDVRNAARDALPLLADRNNVVLVNAVAKRLDHEFTYVRVAAASALPLIAGPGDVPSIEVVASRLAHSNRDVRLTAGNALGQLEKGETSPAAVTAVIKHLENSDEEVRKSVVNALNYVGKGNPDAINAVAKHVQDPSSIVRASAEGVLKRISTPRDDASRAATWENGSEKTSAQEGKRDGVEASGSSSTISERESLEHTSSKDERPPSSKDQGPAELDHPDWRLRRDAVLALSASTAGGDAKAVHLVAPLHRDALWQVRLAVADALGKLGLGVDAAVPMLAELSRDWSVNVAGAALRSLRVVAAHGHADAVEPIAAALERREVSVTDAAASELQQLASACQPCVSLAVAAAAARLEHEDAGARRAASDALVRMGPLAIKAVASRMSSSNQHMRRAAVNALLAIGRQDNDTIDALLQGLSDVDASVRRAALDALLKLAPRGAQRARMIEGAVALLSHEDDQVRKGAVAVLGHVEDGQIEVVLEAIAESLEDPSADVRQLASDSLVDLALRCHVHPAKSVAKRLEHAEAYVRESAGQALIRLIGPGDGDAVGAVADCVAHSNGSVRADATATLCGVVEQDYVQACRTLLRHFEHPDAGVRSDAVVALARVAEFGDEGVVQTIVMFLAAPVPYVRETALRAVVRVVPAGHAEVEACVVARLSDEDAEVRQAAIRAVEALAKLGAGQPSSLEVRIAEGLRVASEASACIAMLDALLRVAALMPSTSSRAGPGSGISPGARAAARQLGHECPDVRARVLTVFAALPVDNEVITTAVSHVQSFDPAVHSAIVEAVRIISRTTDVCGSGNPAISSQSSKDCVAALAVYLESRVWSVRVAVAHALVAAVTANGAGDAVPARGKWSRNDGRMDLASAARALSMPKLASALVSLAEQHDEAVWRDSVSVVRGVLRSWCTDVETVEHHDCSPKAPDLATYGPEGRQKLRWHRSRALAFGSQQL